MPRGTYHRGLRLWVDPIKTALRQLRSPLERASALTAVSSQPSTRSLRHAYGTGPTPNCFFCGQPDTLFHRVCQCQRSAELRTSLPQEVQLEMSRAVASDPLWTRGWTAAPPFRPPYNMRVVAFKAGRIVPAEQVQFNQHATVASDGSCKVPSVQALAHAA